jgi:hypothetical protein
MIVLNSESELNMITINSGYDQSFAGSNPATSPTYIFLGFYLWLKEKRAIMRLMIPFLRN